MATAKYRKGKDGCFTTLVWDGRYNPDGSKHRKKLTSRKSSADLERKVAELKQAVQNGENTEYSCESFYAYSARWLATYKSAKEKNTQRMYRTVVETYLSDLDGVRISDIQHSHIQQLINRHLEHPKTCKNIKSTVSQVIRAAIRDKLLPRTAVDDILGDIALPKYVKPEKRPLTAEEKEAFRTVELDERKAAFLNILYYCGLRRGEALALTRFDFDWKAKTVSINKVLIFADIVPEIKPYPKSDRGIRKVPLPEALIRKIRPFVDASDGGCLFHTKTGKYMTDTGYRRMWESIISSMNIALGYNPNAKKNRGLKPITDLTAHIFRHNYCTELCYQVPAISTKKIAQLMGDDERMVLDVYSHVVEEKENVLDTLNRALES